MGTRRQRNRRVEEKRAKRKLKSKQAKKKARILTAQEIVDKKNLIELQKKRIRMAAEQKIREQNTADRDVAGETAKAQQMEGIQTITPGE